MNEGTRKDEFAGRCAACLVAAQRCEDVKIKRTKKKGRKKIPHTNGLVSQLWDTLKITLAHVSQSCPGVPQIAPGPPACVRFGSFQKEAADEEWGIGMTIDVLGNSSMV